jgi:hypothetical protein
MHGGGAAYQRRVPGLIGRRWHASRRSREYRQSRGCRPKWCRPIVGHSPAHELAADRQSAIWRLRVAGPGAALFHALRARGLRRPHSITSIQRHSDQPHCAGGALSAHRILLFRGPVRRIMFFCLWETRTAWVTDRGAREIAVGGPNPGPGDGKRKGLWSDPGPFLFGSITPRQRTTARLR